MVFAKGGEVVSTRQKKQGGEEFEETTATAKTGDAIVTRSPGDSYVVPAAKFGLNFEINPNNTSQYRSKNFGRAIQIPYDFKVAAPWGDQDIVAGGVIWQNRASSEIYGNQRHSFEGDFAREQILDGEAQ